MIDFENSERIRRQQQYAQTVAREIIRPQARYFDDHEHEVPWDYAQFIWNTARQTLESLNPRDEVPEEAFMLQIHTNEMISWGDAGFYLCLPWPALGGSAIRVAGTENQKARMTEKFLGDSPAWNCMALTEAHCGSDSSAIRTRAVRDGDSWILNGEKLFVTNARKVMIESDGLMVVWATTDPAAGRRGIKPFLVEAKTPGVKIARLEKKLGVRASETAVVVFEDCRIPLENLLGGETGKGFKGAMAVLDSARPAIAASGLGVARAAVDFLKRHLALHGVKIRYGFPRNLLTAMERDVVDMEAQLRAAWLLVLKAAWLVDQGKSSTIESSMCKAKTGSVVKEVTQKCIELMGPQGYSRRQLLEKWMRDGRVTDLFEGTGQINKLVIARRILGYTSSELK